MTKLWKWLFIILAALNVAIIAFVAIRVTSAREPRLSAVVKANSQLTQAGQIRLTRPELNTLVNSYLSSQKLPVKFVASDHDALVSLTYKFLGEKIPVSLYFAPVATADGNVVLSVNSVSAGTLKLPTSAALSYVQNMNLPKFVKVDAAKSLVKIHLTDQKFAGKLSAQAQTIDLANGKFVFNLVKSQ